MNDIPVSVPLCAAIEGVAHDLRYRADQEDRAISAKGQHNNRLLHRRVATRTMRGLIVTPGGTRLWMYVPMLLNIVEMSWPRIVAPSATTRAIKPTSRAYSAIVAPFVSRANRRMISI